MNKLIGLTGGIASGKSTASNYIKSQGYPVLDADIYARKALDKNTPGYHKVIEHFGRDILDESYEIDRKKLGQIIFNDHSQREVLNGIVHPEVRRMMNEEQENLLQYGHVFLDIPLLFENGLDKNCDITIAVFVNYDMQLARLMARNQLSKEDAKSRINSQMSLDEKKKRATCVFDNNGSKDELYQQINDFLNRL